MYIVVPFWNILLSLLITFFIIFCNWKLTCVLRRRLLWRFYFCLIWFVNSLINMYFFELTLVCIVSIYFSLILMTFCDCQIFVLIRFCWRINCCLCLISIICSISLITCLSIPVITFDFVKIWSNLFFSSIYLCYTFYLIAFCICFCVPIWTRWCWSKSFSKVSVLLIRNIG